MGDHRLLDIVLGLLLSTALCWANNKFDADNFLQKYGYLDDLAPGELGHSEATTKEAIKEFQQFNGLQPTGRLDAPTVRKMQQPRCGLPDLIKPSLRPSGKAGDDRRRRRGKKRRNLGKGARGRRQDQPLAFYAPGYKWEKRDIKYNVSGFTRQLNQQDQLVAMRNAFQKWTDVAPLNIRQVTSGAADIVINFFRGSHSAVDGAGNAFDGRGGVLAHAFFPGTSEISGDTHFDDDEEWTLGTERGTNLEIVAAHEFGHALGLGHSNRPTALMAPYYQGYKADFKLEADDISGIQSLYGSGRGSTVGSTDGGGTPQTQRPTPSTTTTSPPPAGRYCNVTFDDIDRAYDGATYAFRGDKVYKVGPRGVEQRQNLGDLFQGAPSSPGAVVYDPYKRILFIFKGTRYWRFTNGFRLDSGYPKELPPDFQNPRAAFIWSDGQLYLFLLNNTFVRWAEGLTRPWVNAPPLPVRNYFQGAPTNIEAALKADDGFYYFFKDTRYWKFNSRAVLQDGYPKDTRPAWLSCGPYQPR